MRPAALVVLGALALSGVRIGARPSPGAGGPQAPQQTFATGVHSVSLYTTVVDGSGRLAPDLSRHDFEVLDNGRRQDLTLFSADSQPISVIILLDRSGSMAQHAARVTEAAGAFVDQLGPADRARIGTFSHDVLMQPEVFTSDARALRDVLRIEVQRPGPTPLWRATDGALHALGREAGRRVVLLFSDGEDSPEGPGPHPTFADVQARAQAADVMVYAIGFGEKCQPNASSRNPLDDSGLRFQSRGRPPGRGGPAGGQRGRGRPPQNPLGRGRILFPPPRIGGIGGEPWPGPERPVTYYGCRDGKPAPELRALAGETGGGYFELAGADDLPRTFTRVADELHRQYLLGYAAPALDGQAHAVEIRMKVPGLSARARKSYVAPVR
jgi:VWFA-related protein